MSTEDFLKWNAAVDELAKQMRPTRHGNVTAKTFMEHVEAMFRGNGWDFAQYVEAGNRASAARTISR